MPRGLLDGLLDIQQSDGGWAYSTNSSWTEPTCYATLALRWAGGTDTTRPDTTRPDTTRPDTTRPDTTRHHRAISRAAEWLARRQRRDGGWSPGSAVEQSTHVTSLSILALSALDGYEDITDRGVHWILSQAGAESSFWERTARLVMGTESSATRHSGWPWFPGAAAWVIPTSFAIFALLKQRSGRYAKDIEARVKDARSFLLSRRCPDHGWNHGGLFRSGERPSSYPETTGIALLALKGTVSSGIAQSIRCAEQHAREPRSSEGACWLRLGLAAHGRYPASPSGKYRDWTVNQVALGILTQAGKEGSNPFIDHV